MAAQQYFLVRSVFTIDVYDRGTAALQMSKISSGAEGNGGKLAKRQSARRDKNNVSNKPTTL
jgi:hypothetical protein